MTEIRSWDTSVGIATGYRLDCSGSISGREKFSHHPDKLCGPPIPLTNEYRELFPGGKSGRGSKLTTHLLLVPRSRMVELYLHSLIRLHGIVLN
jgi:hypothetical protein